MSYEHTLNECLEASALRFSRLEASLRRIEVHPEAIMEVMQGKESQEFPSEEVGEEETNIEMKESKPYVPPSISQSRLLKSIWYRLFPKLIKPLFQVHIYLPLLYVIRNTPVDDKYF
ncbi:hypothetical protein QYF36_022448 [Acer negundo]|nr:hypothetical protein QYF36_022448 [Acer negundo]